MDVVSSLHTKLSTPHATMTPFFVFPLDLFLDVVLIVLVVDFDPEDIVTDLDTELDIDFEKTHGINSMTYDKL